MNTAELREKTPSDLRDELQELLREQFNFRMQKGSGQLGQLHKMKIVRRGIARIYTILNEKKHAGKSS